MWGGKPDLMEVTEIAFDPYQKGRILVGTRDAGIIFSFNGGKTWRTIFNSPRSITSPAFISDPKAPSIFQAMDMGFGT